MAYGDQLNIVQGNNNDTTLTVTYSGGTAPSANDLNCLYAFTGATTITSMTSGFNEDAELLNTSDSDEGGLWSQVAAGSGDNTCTMTPSAGDENGMIMVLFEGSFAAAPLDLSDGHNGAPDTTDPTVTGASATEVSQSNEVMCGICCQRGLDDESATAFGRQGTATPISDMAKPGDQGMDGKRIYAASQVLTGVGTVGVSRANASGFSNMVGYATYKAGVASPDENEDFIAIHKLLLRR